MTKRLYISNKISNLAASKTSCMHNLYANSVKTLEICKLFPKDLVNELGNKLRCDVVPKVSDLEVVALSMTCEAMSIKFAPMQFRQRVI